MKSKTVILFFLILSALLPTTYAADYGEDDDYLGQVVDDYETDDNVSAVYNMVHNETLDCMELVYSAIEGMILQDFTTYTEVDEGDGVIVTDTSIVAMIARNKYRHVYYDFGANYFGSFKVYGKFMQDWFNPAASSQFAMFSNYIGDEKELRDNNRDYICMSIGGDAGNFKLSEYSGGSFYGAPTKVFPDDTYFWFKMEKVGQLLYLDVYTTEELRDAEGNGDWYDEQLTLQVDYSFRYFYVFNSRDDNRVQVRKMYIYDYYLNGTLEGYEATGHFYTVEMIDGDLALAVLYNVTIPEDTAVTMEFSKDNVTWVDHNDVAGHDVLTEGHETLDLRDLNTTSLYQRVNMTSDGSDTPRFLQNRIVTTTAQPIEGDGEGVSLFPGLAIGISLLIIGAAYLVAKRG